MNGVTKIWEDESRKAIDATRKELNKRLKQGDFSRELDADGNLACDCESCLEDAKETTPCPKHSVDWQQRIQSGKWEHPLDELDNVTREIEALQALYEEATDLHHVAMDYDGSRQRAYALVIAQGVKRISEKLERFKENAVSLILCP